MDTLNKAILKQRRIEHIKTIRKEKMKKEAIKQMKIAEFKEYVIKDFESNNIIYVSRLGQELKKATDKQVNLVKAIEEYRDIKVYHLQQRNVDKRELLYYFFINNKLQNKVITQIRRI